MNKIFRNPILLRLIALTLLVFIFIAEVYARAGGGGGSSGGGGGDGLGELIFWIIMMLPFPLNVIVIGILIIFVFFGRKKAKQMSVLNNVSKIELKVNDAVYKKFLRENPSFSEEAFKKKVEVAFTGIQNAWMNQDLKTVRKFITDGVYQRFNTQFTMMKELEQHNELKNIKLHDISIVKIHTDGLYSIIDVAIHASMTDHFKSDKFKQLNSGGYESFIEYWSFLKKDGESVSDLYSSQNCPKCGAELNEIQGEISKCSYCGAITNSGEFDWVLSEITQADDYAFSSATIYKQANLNEKIASMLSHDKNTSIQLLEDKASNAFLQIETARVKQNASMVRRFMSDEAYHQFEKYINTDTFTYNRIFLNDVTAIGAWVENGLNNIAFYIRKSSQKVRVSLNDKNEEVLRILDPAIRATHKVIVLSREVGATENNKNSLYTHQCPSCAGILSDTTDVKCPYCGSSVNSPKTEWIVEGVYSINKYKQKISGGQVTDNIGINVDKFDKLLDVRDYAFNNAMLMMAADGVFTPEERELAFKLAKKFGYNPSKIEPIIELALNNRLVLRMPDNPKKHSKIIKLMEKAAMIDDDLHPKEKELLDFVRTNFG